MDDFDMTKTIGTGKFSTVYKATNKHTGQAVALKKIQVRLVQNLICVVCIVFGQHRVCTQVCTLDVLCVSWGRQRVWARVTCYGGTLGLVSVV